MENTETKKDSEMRTIKITNRNFLGRLHPTFLELSELPSNKDSGELKYAVKRSIGSFQDALDRYYKKRKQILEDKAKKDGDGNPIFDQYKNYLFNSPQDKEVALENLDKLDNEEIQLTIYPVSLENILKATKKELSIVMEINLEGFIK